MQAVQSENGDKSPKKNRAKGLDSEPHEQPYDTSQRKEKRKKRDPEEREESMEHKARLKEAEGESEPPKKRHKNRTNFADPREDTQLNAQSRKVLEYVFTQMNRPSRWKFNKARQNWLIRNVCSSESIPDIYFPLVLKYLTNVQGGSREKLKENCQNYLTAQAIPVEVPPSTLLAEADTAKPTPASIKRTRAQSLLNVLT